MSFQEKLVACYYFPNITKRPLTRDSCQPPKGSLQVIRVVRVVQIVKSALRQARITSEDPDTTLPRFLLHYHITLHNMTTDESHFVLI